MFRIKNREKAIRTYDFFLVFLAVISVGLIIAQERMDLSESEGAVLEWIDLSVWLLFVGDYFTRFYLAADKRRYVKTHII